MQSIKIEVLENKTTVSYVDNGNKIFSYDSPVGDDYCHDRKYSKHASTDWFSYIEWCLLSISYVDRIPDRFYLFVNNNAIWYSSILNMQSYAQFYIKNLSGSNKPHVIIESSNRTKKDERYQKTISQFKI
ncbi:MAG: hypothetical protein QG614_332 [Patescibacteria group bacterium]|nr:hypothetical protein [Patescibacteria group bacterium]